MNRFVLVIFTYCSLANLCLGQVSEVDSLRSLLAQPTDDTSRVIILNRLAFSYYRSAPDSSLIFANEAMELATKVKYERGIANSFNSFGIVAYSQSQYGDALTNYEKFLEKMTAIDDKRGMHKAHNNIGIVYKNVGDYSQALIHFQKSSAIIRELGELGELGRTLNNMGLIYKELGEYAKALDCFMQSIAYKTASGNLKSLSSTYVNLGLLKASLGEFKDAKECYDKSVAINKRAGNKRGLAIDYQNLAKLLINVDSLDKAQVLFTESLKLNEEINNRSGIADLLNEIGGIYLIKDEFDISIDFFQRAFEIKRSISDKRGIVQSGLNLAKSYFDQNKFSSALKYSLQAFEIARELGIKQEIVDASDLIYRSYNKRNNFQKALYYLETNKNYNDSLIDEIKLKEIATIESRYLLDRISRENELLQKENALSQTELGRNKDLISNQRLTLILSGLIIVIALTSIFLIYKLYLAKKEDNRSLEELNRKMLVQKNQLETQAVELKMANNDIIAFNEALEVGIQERTLEIEDQNRRLREYAFANSHEMRAPLARLLGLADQWKKEETTEEQRQTLNVMMEISAKELDDVIRKNHKLLYVKEKVKQES